MEIVITQTKELYEKAVSRSQQRFFGMVRQAQKTGQAASPEVAQVAADISKKDAKDFASTKHKGLPEKKEVKEGASIIQGGTSRKKVSYRGPTAEKSKPKKSVSYRGEKDERIPVLNRKGKENKSARYASQLHRLRPASERMGKKKVDEASTPMKDNNLFGNAYAGSYETLKKKIGSKKKHDKPAIKEASFKDYMAQAQAARDREKKRREDRKKADAQYSDTRKHGVRFYDKKGRGRIKSGKKIYD